jgi:hypothetical protein
VWPKHRVRFETVLHCAVAELRYEKLDLSLDVLEHGRSWQRRFRVQLRQILVHLLTEEIKYLLERLTLIFCVRNGL